MPLIPTPYDQRIQQQRKRIKRHDGSDKQLRGRLDQLRLRRYKHQQANRPPEPMPWNAQYETTVGGLNQNYNTTIQNLASQEQGIQREYGFNDFSNPYSRARQLQQGFQRAQAGTLNNYAASGQLYAGSLSNARNIDRTNFETSYNTEKTRYEDLLRELAAKRLEASNELEQGKLEAEAQRLEDAINERVDPAEAPGKPAWVKKLQRRNRKGGRKR